MSTISLDYIKDIIDTCKDGNLLITYYRDYDVELERIDELFKYIDKNKSKDCNWIKINVTDCPEICGRLNIYPPCTVWYKNNLPQYNFGSYMEGDTIIHRMKHLDSLVFDRDGFLSQPIGQEIEQEDYE